MGDKANVVVIGGGPAGMTAASRIKRIHPEWRVMVFERSKYVSYAPCGIPYFLGGYAKDIEELVHYPLRVFKEERGIEVYTETEVVEAGNGFIRARFHDGSENTFSWEKLLIATGARPRIPPIPGVELSGVLTIRTLESGEEARRAVDEAKRIAIIGGGYIGLELADNLRRIGKSVMLFEMLPHVMPTLDADIAQLIEAELIRNGVDLHLGEALQALEGHKKVEKIVTDKGEYKVDLVFLATGVTPETHIAEMLGVRKGNTGAISTDPSMRTNLENVYAAGDNAEAINLVTGKPDWFPLAPVANKMGYVAGASISGIEATFPGALGTAITKVFDLEVARTGLTEERAIKEGFNPASVVIKANSRASYYPGGSPMTVKLIADRNTGRLLGAQIVGSDGVLARIDALAALIGKGGNVRDLFFSDLAYAPPFAPVWDPVIVAARVLLGKIEKE
ncbi:MAG: FAD-dependent oxidoreductase [Infirmifilum sp.]|jgi:NADPH-dependent 2,4-dienoyl-CoA reductase/sulfur reductase-like enzyme